MSTSEILRLKGTGEVKGERERPNDDLPCQFCDSVGGVLIAQFKEQIYDVCRNCAFELGLD